MSVHIVTTIILCFALTAYVPAEDIPLPAKKNMISTQNLDLQIPVYEMYAWSDNYMVNQPITNFFRWTFLGGATGLITGGIVDLKMIHDGKCVFIPVSLVTSMVGLGAGGLFGSTAGLIEGARYNKIKATDSQFHIRRYRFGYMGTYEFAPFDGSAFDSYYEGFGRGDFDTGPNAFLIFRTLSKKRFLPDRFELGWGMFTWGKYDGKDTASVPYDVDSRLYKIECNSLYSLMFHRLLSCNYGIGAGYCWGREYVGYYHDNDPNSTDIQTFYLKFMLGLELNCFDFLFADVSFQYEPVGVYYAFKNHDYYPYMQNFTLRFSVGTYVF